MNDRIEEICNNATFGNGQQNGLQVEGGSYNATAARIGHANHNKVVEPPSWWSNPYLEPNGSGWFKQPSVPAVVWWLQHPIMGLSHVRYNVVDNVIEVELATWDERPHSWSDADASFLLCRLQELTRGLVKNRADLLDALVVVARQREYSPLLEQLEKLPSWDGVTRAATLLTDFLGAEDTPYTRAVSTHMLKGALMRVRHPGCKFDECVVLSSQRQGIGKSTLLRKLSLDDRYFTDSLGDIGKKDAAENLQGKWIVEIGELESLKKKERETVKLFLSKQDDRYRAPYAKLSETRPRRCIFVGTTNSTTFLSDPTGNRRFLPVKCDVVEPKISVFSKDAQAHIEQVWAEMLHMYRESGPWALVLPSEILKKANEACEAFTVPDPKEGMIANWLEKDCMPGERICAVQVLEQVFDVQRAEAAKPTGRALTNEIVQVFDSMPQLRRIDGRPKHSSTYGQQRCWEYLPLSGCEPRT